LGAQIGLLDRQAGDVAALTRKAFIDAVADRISCGPPRPATPSRH